tara:strand:+ start:537 stop:755 length:219 start_codon:yes stop_codon:yes gene_type:complete
MTVTYTICSLEQIKNKLKGMRLLHVADMTDLSYPTINDLAKGERTNYAYTTIARVSEYFCEIDRKVELNEKS